MSERPFEPPPSVERRYGEMRCRRYLFDRSFEAEAAPESAPTKATTAAAQGEQPRTAARPQ